MNRKNLILILLIIGISSSAIVTVFLEKWYSHPESLRTIMFSCTTGTMPGGFMLTTYDNGTHTIDLNSCVWRNNITLKHSVDEYQEINSLSCSELIERHATGKPYANKENKMLAQAKILNCNSLKNSIES